MTAGDRVRVSVLVDLPLEDTFRVFTEEIDQWWLRGSRFRASGPHRGVLHLESRLGGGLFEAFEDNGEHRVVRTGTVTRWEPPRCLEIAWRNLNFTSGEVTRLSVGFEAGARGTLVTVTHEGWAGLRPDHPSRHGLATGPFLSMMGRCGRTCSGTFASMRLNDIGTYLPGRRWIGLRAPFLSKAAVAKISHIPPEPPWP